MRTTIPTHKVIIRAATAVIIGVVSAAGCGSTQRAESSSEDPFGVPMRSAAPIAGIELFPLAKRTGEAESIENNREDPHRVEFSLVPDGDKGARQVFEGVRITHLLLSDEGQILIVREEEYGENVAVEYSPPIPLLPKWADEKAPITGESKMTILGLRDGTYRDQGVCTYRIELLGRQSISTPSGSYDAYIVKTHRSIELGLADARVTIWTAYVPQLGWVAERIAQIHRPLRLFEVKHSQTILLAQ